MKGREQPWEEFHPRKRKALWATFLRGWMSVGQMMLFVTCWPFLPYWCQGPLGKKYRNQENSLTASPGETLKSEGYKQLRHSVKENLFLLPAFPPLPPILQTAAVSALHWLATLSLSISRDFINKVEWWPFNSQVQHLIAWIPLESGRVHRAFCEFFGLAALRPLRLVLLFPPAGVCTLAHPPYRATAGFTLHLFLLFVTLHFRITCIFLTHYKC